MLGVLGESRLRLGGGVPKLGGVSKRIPMTRFHRTPGWSRFVITGRGFQGSRESDRRARGMKRPRVGLIPLFFALHHHAGYSCRRLPGSLDSVDGPVSAYHVVGRRFDVNWEVSWSEFLIFLPATVIPACDLPHKKIFI